jgi:hypothetical protein
MLRARDPARWRESSTAPTDQDLEVHYTNDWRPTLEEEREDSARNAASR